MFGRLPTILYSRYAVLDLALAACALLYGFQYSHLTNFVLGAGVYTLFEGIFLLPSLNNNVKVNKRIDQALALFNAVVIASVLLGLGASATTPQVATLFGAFSFLKVAVLGAYYF